jgi:hypothetical protein
MIQRVKYLTTSGHDNRDCLQTFAAAQLDKTLPGLWSQKISYQVHRSMSPQYPGPGWIQYTILHSIYLIMTASVVWWSEYLATDSQVRFRFPALLDILRSSVSGTESTQPRENNWGATWKKSSGSGLEIREYGLGIRHADHMAPSIRKNWY